MELKTIIESALEKSVTGEEYTELLNRYAKEGKTSGPDSESMVYYTKLNASRSRRVMKTVALNPELITMVSQLASQKWILLSETWCGDAASTVPIFIQLASLNDNIELHLLFRDEHPELMDQFLTKGGRAIPKLISVDIDYNVLFEWGPRPEEAQEMYWNWREDENRMPYKEFNIVLQKWYNEDRGKAVQSELIHKLKHTTVFPG